jgi:hypothetical protein
VQEGATWRLSIPPTTTAAYSDAQLDDYDVLVRNLAHAPPIQIKLRARFSSHALKGTAGFGFWNHPFGQEGQVLAPPCNIWFFHGSPESDLRIKPHFQGYGFKAAVLRSPMLQTSGSAKLPSALSRFANALLRWPLLARMAMRAAQAVVAADEAVLDLDLTAWHEYYIDWQHTVTRFCIDGREVLRTHSPPQPKLGFVVWIDNYKAIAAEGKYEFGYVACDHEQWLEVQW